MKDMKKHIYVFACASVLVAGCSSEDDILQKPSLEPTPQETPETFSITASFDGVTRTHTASDHLKSLWSLSDKIYIGAASTMAPYTVSSLTNGGATAIFTGTTAFSEGSYAVYGGTTTTTSGPSINETKEVSGITVPASWTYDKANDCANVLLMGEVNTSSQTITFKHAGGVLYVDLGAYATSFKAIRVTSDISTTNSSAVNISGDATITWDATNQYPTYTCASGNTITINAANNSSFEAGTKIIVPVPAATYGNLSVDACMVNGTEFDNQILSISDVTIERKKSYTVTFTGTPVTSVGTPEQLLEALNNTAGCNVKLSSDISLESTKQSFTISGTNATVVDLNGNTLTAQKDNEGKVSLALNVGSGTATEATPFSQSFTLKNGKVVIEEGTTELTITNACNIYLDHVDFQVPVTNSAAGGSTYYTIKINISNTLKDSNGQDTTDILSFSYHGKECKINGKPMDFTDFTISNTFTGVIAEKVIDEYDNKIVLQITRTGSGE